MRIPCQSLSERLAKGSYRARPVRRHYVDKADGRKRPIGIPVLEDKIVERAAVEVLQTLRKPRLIEFGRFAKTNRERRGEGKPETFDFLGFTHYCDKTHKTGRFIVGAKLQELKKELRRRMDWIKQ